MRALSALTFAAGSGDRLRADAIHRNTHVVTVDDDFRIVEAFAVVDGRFAAVGTEAQVPSAFPDGAEREADFGGKTVLPGVNDNHIHLGPGGTLQNWQDGMRSPGEANLRWFPSRRHIIEKCSKPSHSIPSASSSD